MFLRNNKLEWNLQLILLVKVWHLVRSNVEEEQQPEHVSINTSSSELSSSSSSSKNPTRKGWAFSVSEKEEAF